MKRLIGILFLVFLSSVAFAQFGKTTLVADEAVIRDSFELGGTWINEISSSADWSSPTNSQLATRLSIKNYVNTLVSGATDGCTVYQVNDTTAIVSPLECDIAYISIDTMYIRDSLEWLPFLGGGGGGIVDSNIYATRYHVDSIRQVQVDTNLVFRTDIDANASSIASVEDSISVHRTDIDTLVPDIRTFYATDNSFDVTGLEKINILDFDTIPAFTSIIAEIDSNAAVGNYLFHLKNTSEQVVNFSDNFRNASGEKVDGSPNLYLLNEDQMWHCYYDLSNYYCNTKTFLEPPYEAFVTVWDTRLVSPDYPTDTLATDSLTLRLPLNVDGQYGFIVDWGDGTGGYVNDWNTSASLHIYDTAGIYTVSCLGLFERFSSSGVNGDKNKLTQIVDWGTIDLGNRGGSFSNTANLDTILVASQPANINTENMFSGASSLKADLSTWDVSNQTNMYQMFDGATAFNSDLSAWDVSSATNMERMFRNASSFNQDLDSLDVSNVTNFSQMFLGALVFNGDVTTWDVSSATTLRGMFIKALVFNQDISGWNTSNVTDMASLFFDADDFNQPIGNWDVLNVTDMSKMFDGATAFNQNISQWDVRNVTNFTDFMNSKTSADYNAAKLDSIYNLWTELDLNSSLNIDFGSIEYTSAGAEGREFLTRANAAINVSGASDNGGEIQIDLAATHGLSTGDKIRISNVVGTTEANGAWNITIVDTDSFKLDGSVFSNTYVSGGICKVGYGWTITDGGQQ